MIYKFLINLALLVVFFSSSSDYLFAQKKKSVKNKQNKPIVVITAKPLESTKSSVPATSVQNQHGNLRLQTFELVWKIINDNYFDQTFNGINWLKIREEFLPKVNQAKTDDELFNLLQEMINRLNRSHFFIIPPNAYAEIEKAKVESRQQELARKIAEEKENKTEKNTNQTEDESDILNPEKDDDFYRFGLPLDVRIIDGKVIVTEIEKESNAEKAGIKRGYVVEKINGVTLSGLIDRISVGNPYAKHLKDQMPRVISTFLQGLEGTKVELTISDENNVTKNILIEREGLNGELVSINKNLPLQLLLFEKESINEQIGYVKFNQFAMPALFKFCDAITEFKNKEFLIIDLRGNSGGLIGVMMGMVGLLTDTPISIGTEVSRYGKENRIINPMPKNYKGKLIVLIDSQSVSAAEMFTVSLKENGRAIVIGETTAGQALPAMTTRLPIGGIFLFPVANFQSPQGNIVEGKGVSPDLTVSLTRQSLLNNQDLQLQKALDITKNRPESKTKTNVIPALDDEPPPVAAKPKPAPAQIPGVVQAPVIENIKDEKALQLIKNFVKMTGGEENLRKISSYQAQGTMTLTRSGGVLDGKFTIYRKAPDKLAEIMELDGIGEIRDVFDGKKMFVQSIYTGVIEQKFKSIFNEQQTFADLYEFLNFEKNYQKIKYLGIFSMNARKVHLIEATTKDYTKIAYAFDTETGLLVSRNGNFLNATFEKYKKFGEILYPTVQTRSGMVRIEITDLKVNADIPESKFEKEENCLTKID